MLRYTTDRARPGLVTFYDIRPVNGAGLFLQPRNPHRASEQIVIDLSTLLGTSSAHIKTTYTSAYTSLDQWCLRRRLNITWYEHVTNSEIRRRTGQPLPSDIVCARCLKLFGHVARADKSQDHSRALRACIWHSPKNWKWRLGRPRHTWLRTVEADLRPFNLGLASGFKKAQDRTTWRTLTGTATSPTSPELR